MNSFDLSPQNWMRVRLRNLIKSSKNGSWGSESGSDETDVVCIRVADFDFQNLRVVDEDRTIRSIPASLFSRIRLESGDILLEKSGGGEKTPVGRAVRYESLGAAICSNFVARVRASHFTDNRYLIYVFSALYLSGYAHQFIKQNTGIQNLDDFALLNAPIAIPDRETQKAIADFLDRETTRIDQLIQMREAFLFLIDEKKASLAVKAVDGSILGGVAKGIEGWFGALPESWQVKRAKFLFRERQDRSESGEEELLTVSHITGVTRRSDKNVNS